MKTYTTTRDITIQDEVILAGTPVLASWNEKTQRTVVVVRGIGSRAFQVAPVIL